MIDCTDVNLWNDSGKNFLASKIYKKKEVFVSDDYEHHKIILKHVAKLKTLDLQVDIDIQNAIYSRYVERSWRDDLKKLKKYFEKCLKELKKAKNTKVKNSWITFLDLLVQDESKFVKYAGNEDLVEDCEKRSKKFPIYGEAMRNNVSQGVEKRKLFDDAANKLSDFWPIFNPMHLIIWDVLDALYEYDWEKLCE